MRTVAEMVKGGQVVRFKYYRNGSLWYETECGFLFPVPTSDIGDGPTFLSEDKALLFMRWIRKYHEVCSRGKES